jgi:hypothetical protein
LISSPKPQPSVQATTHEDDIRIGQAFLDIHLFLVSKSKFKNIIDLKILEALN